MLREQAPLFSTAAAHVGDPQIRNRGAIGGSLAHADPAADYPAPCWHSTRR
jgi:carbon-monoxide dehydrogenase medium subunit